MPFPWCCRKSLIYGLIIFLAVCLRIYFFNISISHLPPTADEAGNYLQAEDIAHGETPLLFLGQPYLFPVEAYLYSPLSQLLPHNAFGTRIVPFLINLLSIILILYAMSLLVRPQEWFYGLILFLFPSAYAFCSQSAYFLPLYPTFFLFSALLMILAAQVGRHQERVVPQFIAGVLGGLAFSSNLLILSVLTGVGCVCCSGSKWSATRRRSLAFLSGLAMGLTPFLLAKICIENAYGPITGHRTPIEAMHFFMSAIIPHQLPGALGFFPPVFPDFEPHLFHKPFLEVLASIVILSVLTIATAIRLEAFRSRLLQDRWLSVVPHDMPVIISWACLLLCAFSIRTNQDAHRYALPFTLVFPLLCCQIIAQCGYMPRRFFIGFINFMIVGNIVTTFMLMDRWQNADILDRIAETPPLDELLTYLNQSGLTRIYGSFWLANRITYQTERKIICSQLFNERFPGWQVPYKSEVMSAEKKAIVLLNDRSSSKLKKIGLKSKLYEYGYSFDSKYIGNDKRFIMWNNFTNPETDGENLLSFNELDVMSSVQQNSIHALVDGDFTSVWSSIIPQREGMWIQVNLPTKKNVKRLVVYYDQSPSDLPPQLDVKIKQNDEWRSLESTSIKGIEQQISANGWPVLFENNQNILLNNVTTGAIRFEIQQGFMGKPWKIKEIEVRVRE